MSEDKEKSEESTESKTFTQDQVNAMLAEQKRKVGEKFADYDEVKAKAEELEKLTSASKSDIEKALERAAKAEAEIAKFQQKEQVAQWASEITKDSPIPATVLRGNTKEELEAHFADLLQLAPKETPPKRTPVPAGRPSGEEQGSRAAAALRNMRGAE